MHNNISALRHPTIQRKIRQAIWLARLAAYADKKKTGTSGISKHNYVQNRHGQNIMRIDYYTNGGLVVYGDQARNITAMIQKALA